MILDERVAKAAYEEMIRQQGHDPHGVGPVASLAWEDQSDKCRADWVAAIQAAVLAEREFWEKLIDQARGALAEVFLADDLDEEGRKKKAKAHYDRIVEAVEKREGQS